MSELTETQLRNVDILRSQGDDDERIAANLHIPVEDVPADPDAADAPAPSDPPPAPEPSPVTPPVAPAPKR